MNNKFILSILIGIVLAILFLSPIYAVPPVTTIQSFTEGYEIKIPQDNILKTSEAYDFEFHVYNISNGRPIISGIACYFHLYNSTGNHIVYLTDDTPSNTFDYEFDINKNNFTIPGIYYYNIQCNDSNYGGFHSSILEVNDVGRDLTSGKIAIMITGLLLIVLISLFLMIFGIYSKTLIVKVFSLGLSILLIAFSSGYMINMLDIGIPDFTTVNSSFNGFFYGFVILLICGGAGLMLFLLWYATTMFSKLRGFKD